MSYSYYDDKPPYSEPLDEGWWASILADEEKIDRQIDIDVLEKPKRRTSLMDVDWDYADSLYENDAIITMIVYGFNRGGLLVENDNLKGFVPISHLIDSQNYEDKEEIDFSSYLGTRMEVKIIECEPTLERIVFSERAALAREGQRKEIFRSLNPGDTVEGIVTNVTDFGVFVDLGGVEGLVHVSELSWGRVQHPSDIIDIGEKTKALVLKVCEESGRVAMSVKQLLPNPWITIKEQYKPGNIVVATVTSILHFGVFARLDEGIEGLIHVSSMALPAGEKRLDNHFNTGQKLKVRILHIDAERRRLGLAMVNAIE